MARGRAMTGPVDEPVHVTDNGVRSFIPPTFCFELRDSSGALVRTVSRLRWDTASLSDFDAMEELARRGVAAVGAVTEYDAGPMARMPGMEFAVSDTVPASPPP